MPSMTLTCCICNLPMQKAKTSKPQGEASHHKCRDSHGAYGYRKGCRCDKCKAGHNASCLEYAKMRHAADGVSLSAQWRRAQRGVASLVTVECVICSKPLGYVRTDQVERPMHKACKATAPNWIRRGTPSPRVEAFNRKIERAALGTTGGKRVFTAGNCGWCGEYFIRAQAKWCSSKCKESSRFALKSIASFKISPKARIAIYERDGWTCQLCQHPVDRELHYLNAWAASLDHVIPQSHQLIPDHSPAALRLAHRWCNSARGDGTNMDESELVRRASETLGLTA